MQQDVGRARRVDTQRGADDARAGHGRLDQIILEIVFEKFGRAHREKAYVFVHFFLAQSPELLSEEQQFPDITRPERGRVGRCAHQGLADELRVARQVRLEAVHGVGIVR